MVNNTVISFPIPPYSNPPIQPQYYQPSLFFIAAILEGLTTTITTTVNHNYVVGQLCRLVIPPGFGSRQLNELTGNVLSIPSPNQVLLDINSQSADAFISNASVKTQPQIVAIGDSNSGQINLGMTNQLTFIPGSFQNISPL